MVTNANSSSGKASSTASITKKKKKKKKERQQDKSLMLSHEQRVRQFPSQNSQRSITAPSKFQSLTRSLLKARLRTSRGGPAMSSIPGLDGCGATLDDDAKDEFALGGGIDNFLVMQLAMAEHPPSLSELETE
ncbi:hypothetical protein OIU77_004697 [Salix suchowensis]|nr:hypothetical protein OIU77_004697 [Salix suchowensis]